MRGESSAGESRSKKSGGSGDGEGTVRSVTGTWRGSTTSCGSGVHQNCAGSGSVNSTHGIGGPCCPCEVSADRGAVVGFPGWSMLSTLGGVVAREVNESADDTLGGPFCAG